MKYVTSINIKCCFGNRFNGLLLLLPKKESQSTESWRETCIRSYRGRIFILLFLTLKVNISIVFISVTKRKVFGKKDMEVPLYFIKI